MHFTQASGCSHPKTHRDAKSRKKERIAKQKERKAAREQRPQQGEGACGDFAEPKAKPAQQPDDDEFGEHGSSIIQR